MRPYFQGFILVLAIVGLANMIGGLFNIHDGGTFGLTGQSSNLRSSGFQVKSVTPNSPAANAGIRPGDVLAARPGFANRVMLAATVPGDTITVSDGKRTLNLTAVTDNSPVQWVLLAVVDLAKLAFIGIALVVAWRRPEDSAARALATFLVCFGAAINFDFVLLPSVIARFLSLLFLQSAFLVGALAVLTFACRFPSPPTSGIRKNLERSIVPLGVAGFAVTLASFTSAFFLANPPLARLLTVIYVVIYLALILGALVALIESYRNAVTDQRARMRWVIGTLAFGFSGIVVLFTVLISGIDAPWFQYAGLTVSAIPFGLGYVILRHRVLDIGFVINRAVVYTGVSLVVVGLFITFEWLLGHIVEQNSRASAALQLAGALVLGLSIRFIHTRVDRYVDDLFFRERHAAEAAIRRFAHEAALITDPDILIRRTVEVAQRNARLHGAAFYARRGARYEALHSTFADTEQSLDENDEAILEMRAWHEPVDVHGESKLPGYVAFPMIVRGQLAGFLSCGEKTSHEALAPDERDALRVLSRDAGIALDSLRITRIEQELTYLTAGGELPPQLQARLASLLHPDEQTQPAGLPVRSSQ
jgi:hypothetical protein